MGNFCIKTKEEEQVSILDSCDGCSQLCNSGELEIVHNYFLRHEARLCPSCLYGWLNRRY